MRNITKFQLEQVEKKKNDARAAKIASDTERRNFVNELHDDAQAKAYQDYLKEKQIRDDRGEGMNLFVRDCAHYSKVHNFSPNPVLAPNPTIQA